MNDLLIFLLMIFLFFIFGLAMYAVFCPVPISTQEELDDIGAEQLREAGCSEEDINKILNRK